MESKSEWIGEILATKSLQQATEQSTSSCRPDPNKLLSTQNSFAGLHCADVMVVEKCCFSAVISAKEYA